MTTQRSPREASTGSEGTGHSAAGPQSPEIQRHTYVLDTSVLLSDPWAVTRFAEHAVVLPLVVISAWVIITGAILGILIISSIFSNGGDSDTASTTSDPKTSAPTTAPASQPTPSAKPSSKPPATTKAPSPKPTQPPKTTTKPKPVVYAKLTARQWARIAKDPDAHTGESYIVYGVVTQFDAATGTDTFRAEVDGVKHRPEYGYVDYPTNTLLTNFSGDVSDLVEDDLFTAKVLVLGSFSYDTQIGGSTTVPHLQVMSLTVTGSVK